MKIKNKKLQGLAKVLMLAKKEEELVGLLHDLFTESEIEKAHERIEIFACLNSGMSQRETKKKAHAAIATVSHGAKFLRNSAVIIHKILDFAKNMNWWNRLFWQT